MHLATLNLETIRFISLLHVFSSHRELRFLAILEDGKRSFYRIENDFKIKLVN